MKILFNANLLPGRFDLPASYVEDRTGEQLAELAAAIHWGQHPEDTPSFVTTVHMKDVGGNDLGLFEVRCKMHPVFTAALLQQG